MTGRKWKDRNEEDKKKIQYFTKINQNCLAVSSQHDLCNLLSLCCAQPWSCNKMRSVYVKLGCRGWHVALSCKLKVKPCCHTREETSHTGNLTRQDATKTKTVCVPCPHKASGFIPVEKPVWEPVLWRFPNQENASSAALLRRLRASCQKWK